ncbi:hypothetical protein PL321_18025 [Caloramator sp. mosi_1]|uniref:hypothetical protein n=1 Tax=Caloramator sp. mosi_1 TaxID=3023090 RepID=UPI00235E1328|nr:hypothetical protein [Caloramator sp. mosi_1]WDC84135.1 hypothetical protein PL321_18025 [Caloramator sp. mosi_1]
MDDLRGKRVYFLLITLLVVIILLSNLGQNFKTDGFSTSFSLSNYNALYSRYNNSKNYEEYIKTSSAYIEKFLKSNGLKPVENSYIHNYNTLMPNKNMHPPLRLYQSMVRLLKNLNM